MFATFSHDLTEVHVKADRKIIGHLSATTHLGLTFRKDSKLEGVQLEYDLETYVYADYAHKADDRRSVSGVAVAGVHLCLGFQGSRIASPYA